MIPTGPRKANQPTFQEMALQRIAVLDGAISALDSREDANSKKLRKHDQHLAEKADLEKQLSRLAQGQHEMPSSEVVGDSLVMYVKCGQT
jgi:hypothetical protein